MSTTAPEDFWRYSLAFYDDPDVQTACLSVQDRHGMDVNMVLYLLFRADRGQKLSQGAIAGVDSAVAAWRSEVVQRLRTLRRLLKDSPFPLSTDGQMTLRNEIKRSELQSEKLQQLHMGALDVETTAGPEHEAAAANLQGYADHLGLSPTERPGFDNFLKRFASLRDPSSPTLADS